MTGPRTTASSSSRPEPRVLRHLAIGILSGVGLFIVVGGIYNLSYDTLAAPGCWACGLLVLFGAEVLRAQT